MRTRAVAKVADRAMKATALLFYPENEIFSADQKIICGLACKVTDIGKDNSFI